MFSVFIAVVEERTAILNNVSGTQASCIWLHVCSSGQTFCFMRIYIGNAVLWLFVLILEVIVTL